MIVKLTDDEIREALVHILEKKLDYTATFDPEECYFECEAGEIQDNEIDDIHNVRFVAKVKKDSIL